MKKVQKKLKVRELQTGLFWNGKVHVLTGELSWSKRGKIWRSVEDLQGYFENLKKSRIQISPLWEVLEYTDNQSNEERYPATVLVKTR